MTFVLIAALLFSQAATAKVPSRQWRAANFQGLIVGKSSRAEMIRRFGKPKWTQTAPTESDENDKRDGIRDRNRDETSQRLTWNHYEVIGEFAGVTNIATDTRTGVITRIDFFPERLTKDQVIAHFGVSYAITRYDIDKCLSDEEHESLYETPSGPFVMVEYRRRGIAIAIEANGFVSKIRYVNVPIGSAKSRCR